MSRQGDEFTNFEREAARDFVIDAKWIRDQIELHKANDDLKAAFALARYWHCVTPPEQVDLWRHLVEHFGKAIPKREFDKYANDHAKAAAAEAKQRKAVQNGRDENPLAGLGAWKKELMVGQNGWPKAALENARLYLENMPEWQGVIALDEFKQQIVKLKPPPFRGAMARTGLWTEDDDVALLQWFQERRLLLKIQHVREAVVYIASHNRFHPLRTWLDNLKWDGTSRVGSWLITYLGAKDAPYTRAVGSKWLISAVARVFKPGCQVDHCLVPEGIQGLRKSSAFRALAGDEYFTDNIPDLHTRDAAEGLLGKWIVEFSDLARLRHADAGILKSFLSRRVDHIRLAYGRRTGDFPRQNVFCATTNLEEYLGDETGGRRFWPVPISKVDLDGLVKDRDQLWAEAVTKYHDGESWWFEESEIVVEVSQEQEARYETDVWHEPIEKWLQNPTERFDEDEHPVAEFSSTKENTTISDVLSHCIGKRKEMWTQGDKTRVAKSLKRLGFVRYRAEPKQTGGLREWRYQKQAQ